MNSSPFARLSTVRHSKLVAAIYPACSGRKRPGLDGIRELTPIYVHEVHASRLPSGSASSGPT